MNERVGWVVALAMLGAGCADDGLAPCVPTTSRSETLVLRIAGPVFEADDGSLKGIDLDGLPEERWVDPDGTMGIDTQAISLDSAIQMVFGDDLATAMGSNEFRLEVRFGDDDAALCEVGVALDMDALVPATATAVSWRTRGDLGDRLVEIAIRDVATQVPLRDIGVRLELDDDGVREVVLGGWIALDELHAAVIASFDEREREEYGAIAREVLEMAVDIELPGEPPGVSFAFDTTF